MKVLAELELAYVHLLRASEHAQLFTYSRKDLDELLAVRKMVAKVRANLLERRKDRAA